MEPLVAQSLGGDQENVDVVLLDPAFHLGPVRLVVGCDPDGLDAHAGCRVDLVAHERQQRRHQQGRTSSGFPEQLGRDEVDEALAPPRLLDHEEPTAALHDVSDGLLLSFAEDGFAISDARPQEFESATAVVLRGRRTSYHTRVVAESWQPVDKRVWRVRDGTRLDTGVYRALDGANARKSRNRA